MPENPLKPSSQTVKIRLYGQGLGDCFLLAFPRADQERPFYVVIDCGVGMNTPNEADRMRQIVTDIGEATGGHIDVLAVTHEHYDHVCGFLHAKDIWETFTIGQIWMPWTEIEGDAQADSIRVERKKANDTAIKMVEQAVQKGERGITGDSLGLTAQAGFLGVDLGVSSDKEKKTKFSIAEAYDFVKETLGAKAEKVYCEPGDVFALPGTGSRAYVLGPPRPTSKDGKPLTGKKGTPLVRLLEDPQHMYHYDTDTSLSPDQGMAASRSMTLDGMETRGPAGSAYLLGETVVEKGGDRDADEAYCPFDATLRRDWDEALSSSFFWEHYAGGPAWRRVDDDWLSGLSDLALYAGDFTNNISLVLAFELPGATAKDAGKILLFVGDAQVGNWLSWHEIKAWQPGAGVPLSSTVPNMAEMLGRVAFYKVGHHGSHNATVKQEGLEMKANDLFAFIPVSVPVAQDILGYCPMPFYPVLCRLQEKTGGRVFLPNGKAVEPLPPGTTQESLRGEVVALSTSPLPAKKKGETVLEPEVPLYLEMTLPT